VGPLLVGLDVGTTSSKAVVFDADGRPLAVGKSKTPWIATSHGAEMDANTLVRAAVDALNASLPAAASGPVAGIGITGMGECGALLDGKNRPLAPIIAWHDRRDSLEVADLHARFTREEFAMQTGLPLRGTWSLTKHRWLVRHYPEARRAVRRLNIAEWIVRSLGGEEAAEQSLASRTGWLELTSRQWWPDALEWSGAGRSLMPDLVVAGTPLGRVADYPELDPRFHGAVLTVAGHDHQAATVGAGACRIGDELDSCGTAEALVRTIPAGLDSEAIEQLTRGGITIGWHVLDGHWCMLGGTQGGLKLQQLMPGLGVDPVGPSTLDSAASDLTRGHTDQAWLDALDDVNAEAATIHRAMAAVLGEPRSLIVTGGWSRSAAYLAAKSRAIGQPLEISPVDEPGARGAAMLGGLAAGLYADIREFPHPRNNVSEAAVR
jgi:sugar (pentulose or hexulose) kinase